MRAMILAAGLGTRMRPLTLKTPKPLLTAAGKPLIQFHIEHLVAAGAERIVINHAWLGEQIESALGDGSRFGVELVYSPEAEPLETAGGIRQALPLLADDKDDSFLVVNGDVYTDLAPDRLREMELNAGCDAHLLLVDNPAWHPEGDFHLEDTGLVLNSGSPKLTFSGVSMLRASLFTDLVSGEAAALAPILRQAMASKKVAGERLNAYWDDIGTPERLSALDKRLKGES
ncbi:N-acetylmuramate alpha-1-phosphate uridylyltransferase MurU [Marinobacterium lutimaris]|uniref:MurNAc alpha-1-phosphate uridylyltransferase n=1 Tax=Marinobacterium lutimaris TaxID=568106 RepID=A0A1H6B0W6_9GAMM|nr:nucleotidyltransferase family protein [Marinobacterium lutimaris]SEG54458.1 MurNAc alpha-1-phosphate uridylyltransferase [Marinobacterium lutimaris]